LRKEKTQLVHEFGQGPGVCAADGLRVLRHGVRV
jgi:hypothetical protein